MSPDHVDLGDCWVRHQVEDAVRGPGDQHTDTDKEGQDPEDALGFALVWGEDKLQAMNLGLPQESRCDLFQ